MEHAEFILGSTKKQLGKKRPRFPKNMKLRNEKCLCLLSWGTRQVNENDEEWENTQTAVRNCVLSTWTKFSRANSSNRHWLVITLPCIWAPLHSMFHGKTGQWGQTFTEHFLCFWHCTKHFTCNISLTVHPQSDFCHYYSSFAEKEAASGTWFFHPWENT
jgi:hypothetical protein